MVVLCVSLACTLTRYKRLYKETREYNTRIAMENLKDYNQIDKEWLLSKGFEDTHPFFVLKSNPRIGYNPDTKELIVGYASLGNKVRAKWQLENIMKALLIYGKD